MPFGAAGAPMLLAKRDICLDGPIKDAPFEGGLAGTIKDAPFEGGGVTVLLAKPFIGSLAIG